MKRRKERDRQTQDSAQLQARTENLISQHHLGLLQIFFREIRPRVKVLFLETQRFLINFKQFSEKSIFVLT